MVEVEEHFSPSKGAGVWGWGRIMKLAIYTIYKGLLFYPAINNVQCFMVKVLF
jgi:hypothetical protein